MLPKLSNTYETSTTETLLLHDGPRGKHLVRICMGTVALRPRRRPGARRDPQGARIDTADTTDDRQFSLEIARCFGACGLTRVTTPR